VTVPRTARIALTACIAFSACKAPRPAPDELVVLIETMPGDIDPRLAITGYGAKLARLVAAPLVSCDNDRLEPRADLADEVVQTAPTEYHIRLREARFSHGRPVTAQDVAYTFESAKTGPLGAAYSRIAAIDVLDDRNLRFRLHAPHAPFVTDLDLGIVPKGLPPGPHPIGAGPFRLISRDETHLILERNPHYFRGKVRARRLVFRIIRDDNARLLALVGGSADMTQNTVPPVVLDAVADNERLRIVSGPSSNMTYVGLNLEDPSLRDVRVRRAIAHAIDRERILRAKFRDRGTLATGMLAPLHWAYEPDVKRYAHDPQRARALLDQAGVARPLTLTYKTSSTPFRVALARVMARQLHEVGIDLEIRSLELATLLDDIKRGNFQMFSLQVTEVSEPHYLYAFFHSSRIPTQEDPDAGNNRFRYRNPEFDRLVEDARASPDMRKRKLLYSAAQKALARDLPMIPMFHEDNVVVARRELRGYAPVANARFASLWQAHKQPPRK